jgi:hypothetical protein
MKKQIHLGIFSLALLSLILTIGSCRKTCCHDPQNPECENYDPCFGKNIENEILISRAGYGGITNWFQPDVKFSRDNIYFRPAKKIDGAKYTWYLGTEVIEEYEFVRDFSDTRQTKEQGILIKLIIERPKQTDCFPNDDGLDTFERKIYFYDNHCETLMVGKYKVKFDNLKDSVILQSFNMSLPVGSPGNWYRRKDSCADKANDIYWIGLNSYSQVYPDTTWSGMNSRTLYNNSSLIFTSIWNGLNYIPYDGEIRVNPVTLETSGNYLFRDENHKLTPRIYFNGRKLE